MFLGASPSRGQQEVLLARTADRSVLGGMNDMAFRCEHAFAGAGGLARADLAELNRSLRSRIFVLLVFGWVDRVTGYLTAEARCR